MKHLVFSGLSFVYDVIMLGVVVMRSLSAVKGQYGRCYY